MDCNREEAIRAKVLAEKKMECKDFVAAQKIALKAQQLYPDVENISQLLLVCNVHCSASKKLLGGDTDWYGILQVEKTADEVMIKKQYRKFALLLHPDKNKFSGAEGAFKLIGEAQRILLDKEKRRFHDMKNMPGSYRQQYTNVVPTANRSHPPASNYTPQPRQPVQPVYTDPRGSFWTICPFCSVRYQYLNEVLNRSLRCQQCSQPFIAYDMKAAPAANFAKPVFPQAQMNNTQFPKKFGTGDSRATPAAQNVGKRVDRTGTAPNGRTGTAPNGRTGNVNRKREKKRARDQSELSESELSDSSSESEDEMEVDENDDVQGKPNTGYRDKNVRRSSRQKQKVSYKENVSDGDDDADEDYDQVSKRAKGKESSISTEEEENGGESKGESKEEAVIKNCQSDLGAKTRKDGEPLKQEVGEGEECLPNGDRAQSEEPKVPHKEHEVQVDIDSSSDDEVSELFLSYPDPDFSDFDKDRNIKCFKTGQIWAAYDNQGAMPRFYAMIKKVSSPGFKLHLRWLEADPDGDNEKKWQSKELPISCGKFKFGMDETTDNHPIFSHLVSWTLGKAKDSFLIYPMRGEIWAVFKNWDSKWSCDPASCRKKSFEYDFVVVLTDYSPSVGAYVGILTKVEGFMSLFCRTETVGKNTFIVPPGELFRFSHMIPSHKMTGLEREGVPKNSFELDPAALPLKFVSSQSDRKAKDSDTNGSHDGSAATNLHAEAMEVPESKFFNFETEKTIEKFWAGQIWALYSDEDGLPKYYGRIDRVKTSPVFKVRVSWLSSLPTKGSIHWCDESLPIGCGVFRVLKTGPQEYESTNSFSHQVKFETTGQGKLTIYNILPKKDQLWALYKNWRADMKPSDLEHCDYDIVEILGDDHSSHIEVLVLERVPKFLSVYKPQVQGGSGVTKMKISSLELIKFSHQIPAIRLTNECDGKLRGFWSLDTAALPTHYFSSNQPD